MLAHGSVERLLSGMAKRRMANIVHQRQGLDQIAVQAKLRRNRTGDLRDLNGVSETVAEVVGVAPGEYLRLRFEASKGASMNNAIAVALKIVAIRMRWLGM